VEFIAFGDEKNRKDGVQKNRNQGLHLVYMHAGTNPFEVINQAVK